MSEYDFIELNGRLLESKYGVYVVQIRHKSDGEFNYVGQTGDAKYISARSSFYRLAAHLSYGKSTQNQVYVALQKETKITDRYDFEQWLQAATIKMFFFKVDDFQNLSDTPENKNIHTKKRRETLALETALLEIGRSRGKVLLNSDGLTYKDFNHKLEAAKQIWATLEKQ